MYEPTGELPCTPSQKATIVCACPNSMAVMNDGRSMLLLGVGTTLNPRRDSTSATSLPPFNASPTNAGASHRPEDDVETSYTQTWQLSHDTKRNIPT